MDNKKFVELCIRGVRRFADDYFEFEETDLIPNYDVYVVWLCKTLGNNKAILSTSSPDNMFNMYFECTYNGLKNELYFDVYNKLTNRCIKLDTLD